MKVGFWTLLFYCMSGYFILQLYQHLLYIFRLLILSVYIFMTLTPLFWIDHLIIISFGLLLLLFLSLLAFFFFLPKVYFIWYENRHSCFFWLYFYVVFFFYLLIFNLHMSLNLKQVSCRQHLLGSHFLSIQLLSVFCLICLHLK